MLLKPLQKFDNPPICSTKRQKPNTKRVSVFFMHSRTPTQMLALTRYLVGEGINHCFTLNHLRNSHFLFFVLVSNPMGFTHGTAIWNTAVSGLL